MLYKASAPGSLMVLGEYGVLHGKQALIAAIDRRITVTLAPRDDQKVHINSESFGSYSATLTSIKIESPFQFVLGAISHLAVRLRHGFDIQITSNFSAQLGLGSSAAITVTVLAVLYRFIKMRISSNELVRQARTVIKRVQGGVGSGADVAASVHGGMVAYQCEPMYAEKLTAYPPITVIYSGTKKATPLVIQEVRNHFQEYPNLFQSICQTIGQCAVYGIQAVRKNDWVKLGALMNIQQGLLQSLQVSTPFMQEILMWLQSDARLFGAKISGSGLGDCLIALGHTLTCLHPSFAESGILVPLSITPDGLICEEI